MPEKQNETEVRVTYENIAWKSDRETKFENPDDMNEFESFLKPPNWRKPANKLDTKDPKNNGFKNQDFIVWMRTAAFPKFRKPYRKVIHEEKFADGLPKGKYGLDIGYSILLCVVFHSFR
jgi:hypothetical protein